MKRKLDPNDPAYRGLTREELIGLSHLTRDDKEQLSLELFGVRLDDSEDANENWLEENARRWDALLNGEYVNSNPYRFSIADLLGRSKVLMHCGHDSPDLLPKGVVDRRVSSFSDWVLRLYVPNKSQSALKRGIVGERAIVDSGTRLRRPEVDVPRWEFGRWRLECDGIRGRVADPYEISTLRIAGQTLLGMPDLVFRERGTGRVAIVELKVTSAELPSDGWPNLRAQLWAYSRIDKWKHAPEMFLAGEVWSPLSRRMVRRATYRWVRGDPQLEVDCAGLFREYGGEVE